MSTYRNVAVVYVRPKLYQKTASLQSLRTKGLAKTFKEMLTITQPRNGKLMGTDKFGNEYFENREDMHGRDRWVVYKKWDFDATQAPPEWHQWLHRMSDDVPTETTLPKPFFAQESRENMTGTRGAFKTYNTTVPKITAWEPKVSR